MITQEKLKELLDYDFETGIFKWKVHANYNAPIGAIAGNRHSRGYICICIGRKLYRAHRLAWLYVHGRWPKDQIDHINGDKTDNRLVNLREATQAENMQNCRMRLDNTSGYQGVSYYKPNGKYHSPIQHKGEKMFLGYFDTPELAHTAYLEAKRKLHPFGEL